MVVRDLQMHAHLANTYIYLDLYGTKVVLKQSLIILYSINNNLLVLQIHFRELRVLPSLTSAHQSPVTESGQNISHSNSIIGIKNRISVSLQMNAASCVALVPRHLRIIKLLHNYLESYIKMFGSITHLIFVVVQILSFSLYF